MKKRYTARHLVITGALIALGMLLPMLVHLFGSGNMFLPMHIPVFLGAFLLPLQWSVAVAVILPVFSALTTTMPPLYPVLPIMTFELLGYALGTGILSRKRKRNPYVSLVGGMLLGRVMIVLVAYLIRLIAGGFDAAAYFVNAVTIGLPGIAIQLVIIPPLGVILKRQLGYPSGGKWGAKQRETARVNALKEGLYANRYALVLYNQNQDVTRYAYGRGIAPLYDLYLAHPALLRGAAVYDRAVGKGAAAVLACAGVSSVFARILGEGAKELLEQAGIAVTYDQLVPHILNRSKEDFCPLEKRLLDTNETAACLAVVKDFLDAGMPR